MRHAPFSVITMIDIGTIRTFSRARGQDRRKTSGSTYTEYTFKLIYTRSTGFELATGTDIRRNEACSKRWLN